MLDIKFIRENPDTIKAGAKKKNINIDIDRVLELDKERRKHINICEDLRAQRNKFSHSVGRMKDAAMRLEMVKKVRDIKNELQGAEVSLGAVEQELDELLKQIPNIPFDDVPVGPDASANIVLRKVGKKPEFSKFPARDYMTIAKRHDWIDMERAAKVSGTRFGYIKGELALLELAIIRYAMDVLTKEGFTPVFPPVLVRPKYMEAMGFLHGEAADDVYYLEKDDLYLVGTSEQAIGPMHAGETFREDELPKRYVGFSTCFRREAGSHGRDTKGILRVHQFDKVEMVVFAHPNKSREEHKYLLSLNEKMMQGLELPYQVVHISTGDMGLAKAEQFDIETWIPSEDTYRETHSASNITDFQARRLKIKYKMQDPIIAGLTTYDSSHVHMLNDTCFAIGRTLIAIIENFQTKDGSVKIPKVLQGYMKKKVIPS
jgi:seryl-tRNA synthetase